MGISPQVSLSAVLSEGLAGGSHHQPASQAGRRRASAAVASCMHVRAAHAGCSPLNISARGMHPRPSVKAMVMVAAPEHAEASNQPGAHAASHPPLTSCRPSRLAWRPRPRARSTTACCMLALSCPAPLLPPPPSMPGLLLSWNALPLLDSAAASPAAPTSSHTQQHSRSHTRPCAVARTCRSLPAGPLACAAAAASSSSRACVAGADKPTSSLQHDGAGLLPLGLGHTALHLQAAARCS